ncbi:F0F1 ATP synthase subunit gamma [Alloprevotella sp. OH1205_COT-284]|uniref:F0F1 ATP synthase subunit gamma n=1 Tax=Alloprevotella sp. OH1205_COT-284 TaxID=2491043 RepID=UPI000F5DD49B|nr:F0F1 ATP synthase subunit gamma [Alloprevotella sp. OH1205_COT-284]RRD80423.1 F0F1 ATP synthase subunit gamma [Alloprevotella sp. OH1205_COT-284]
MASLKEVKTRIASVNNTRKITSAMKMVASSKLHHAQHAIERMRPYEKKLNGMMSAFVASLEGEVSSQFSVERKIERVALVVFSSNSSLCGGFNGNVIKQMRQTIEDYRAQGIEVAHLYPIGKKVTEAAKKMNFSIEKELSEILDKPQYAPIAALSAELMRQYSAKEIDRVEILYHHFKSAGSQVLTTEQFLPVKLEVMESTSGISDYIIEPSLQKMIENLIPKALHLKLYSAMLDNLASEHAARVIAMQVATDNADELLRELTLQYNKTRQQAITAELLDIVGGSLQ